MALDTQYFKKVLGEELQRLEEELKTVGTRNPANPSDWEAIPGQLDILASDSSERADSIEEFEENSGILRELEIQYNDVRDALARIENGTYGKCENDGEEIPYERLKAFPAARTCIKHIPKE